MEFYWCEPHLLLILARQIIMSVRSLFSLIVIGLMALPSASVLAQRGDDGGGRGGGGRGGPQGGAAQGGGRGGPQGGTFQGGGRGGTQGGAFQGGGRGGPQGGGRGGPQGDAAQSGGRGGPQTSGRGGTTTGRGGPTNGSFDPTAMLSRMDTNGDGKLQPDEIPDRAKQFLAPRLEQAGFNPNQTITINKISDAFKKLQNGETGTASATGVPGFGEEFDLPIVPGFDLPADSPLLARGRLEDRYSDSVLAQVNSTLARYDRNKDQSLDARELSAGRFTSPTPQESDLNNDGKLSKVELAERYKSRDAQRTASSTRGGTTRGGTTTRGGASDANNRGGSNRGGTPTSGRTTFVAQQGRGGSNQQQGGRGSPQGGFQQGGRGGPQGGFQQGGRGGPQQGGRGGQPGGRGGPQGDDASNEERMQRITEMIFSRYDADGDGVISSKESEGMRGDPKEFDKDGDGKITKKEIATRMSAQMGGGRGGQKTVGREGDIANYQPYIKRSVEERLDDQGIGSEFTKIDANGDGQIQMAEYTKSWSAELIEEFGQIDLNNDGVVTPSEWVESDGRMRARYSKRNTTGSTASSSSSGGDSYDDRRAKYLQMRAQQSGGGESSEAQPENDSEKTSDASAEEPAPKKLESYEDRLEKYRRMRARGSE